MSCSFTPSLCHINLSALARNFQRLGSPENLMPVIKSDAYGHGLLPVAQTLSKEGAKRFAVGTASEGEELFNNGLQQDIVLLMGCLGVNDWQKAIACDLIPLVGSFADLEAAKQALASQPKAHLRVAIKCDTGMARLGFNLSDLPRLIEELSLIPQIEPVMLISHLACADMPEESLYTEQQISKFESFYAAMHPYFPNMIRSLGNSAATLGQSETQYEVCRPGIALYGGNPLAVAGMPYQDINLEWVMSISSPIIHIRDLEAGQSISYGRIFTAPRDMRIAVVASGYASGINRSLSNRMTVLINGKRASQVGRICMGMFMVDITDREDVKQGDLAWIIGGEAKNNNLPITADEMASLLDTISYEILCQFGASNPRVYEDDSK